MVAQEFALRHGRRVARLVLAVTSSGGAGGHSYPLHELLPLAPDTYVRTLLPLTDARLDAAWLHAHPAIREPLVARTTAQWRDPSAFQGLERQLEARRHHATYGRLHQIAAPTLVIGGAYDRLAPADNVRALADAIPGAACVIVSHGHVSWMQDAGVWARIQAFLHEGSD
jgi:3-oxoadipate enol-lactonase